ncbi:MAG: ACT domain-containing protein, partial [Gammaproteobacteria bacterium]|nr:ACT domain-containing protein [Gammaproteobacteria bacterium]
LNIVDARIHNTRDGWTVDTYIILEADGNPIRQTGRFAEIEARLFEFISGSVTPPDHIHRSLSRQQRSFSIHPQITFTRDNEQNRTIMQVITSDRPGLLSRIASVLTHFHITINSAKIATLGERVEDTFFISFNGHALTDPPLIKQLQEGLFTAITDS